MRHRLCLWMLKAFSKSTYFTVVNVQLSVPFWALFNGVTQGEDLVSALLLLSKTCLFFSQSLVHLFRNLPVDEFGYDLAVDRQKGDSSLLVNYSLHSCCYIFPFPWLYCNLHCHFQLSHSSNPSLSLTYCVVCSLVQLTTVCKMLPRSFPHCRWSVLSTGW